MKLRHAAALTLVGWYMMMPPPPSYPGGPVNTSIPLSKWNMTASYDTAKECEKYRSILQGLLANPETGEKTKDHTPRGDAAVCVASDDPRLKEK